MDTKEASKPVSSARSAPYLAARPVSKIDDLPKERAQHSPTGKQAAEPQLTLQETSTQLQPQVMSDFCLNSNDPYSPDSTNVATFDSASATPSSSGRSTYGSNQQYTNILPDMTDIMFPSADPLVYPNQPMMALEDQDLFRTINVDKFSPLETPAVTRGPYEALDTQFFTPVPPYLMQFPQHNLGFPPIGLPVDTSSAAAPSNVMALNSPASGAWPSEQMQQSSGQRGGAPPNYEYPFRH